MYCANCGKELPDNVTSCPACGHEIDLQNLDGIGKFSFDEEPQNEQETAAYYQKKIRQAHRLQATDILYASAIVSLALGVISFFSAPIILGIIAIIAGNIALRKNTQNPLAKAGRILGIISLIMGVISLCVMAFFNSVAWSYFLLS